MSDQTARPYICFYIPSDQLIPTDLRLLVGDVKVKYSRIQYGFVFEVFHPDAEKAKHVVDEIVSQMLFDHDESHHGVTWETVSLEEMEKTWPISYVYVWHYRVRDSY